MYQNEIYVMARMITFEATSKRKKTSVFTKSFKTKRQCENILTSDLCYQFKIFSAHFKSNKNRFNPVKNVFEMDAHFGTADVL